MRGVFVRKAMKRFSLLSLGAMVALAVAAGCSFSASVGNPPSPSTSSSTATNQTAEPNFTDIVLTDNPETKDPKKQFSPSTKKIYAFFNLEGMKEGDQIKGAWVKEDTKAGTSYQLDQAILKIGKDPKNGVLMNTGDFNISSPTKGWPAGTYRVDMYINNQLKTSAKFDIVADKVDDSGKL